MEEPDYSKEILKLTDGKGVDTIFDPILASNFNYNMNSIGVDGKWIMYGALGGTKVNANLVKLFGKRVSIIGTTLRSRSVHYKA